MSQGFCKKRLNTCKSGPSSAFTVFEINSEGKRRSKAVSAVKEDMTREAIGPPHLCKQQSSYQINSAASTFSAIPEISSFHRTPPSPSVLSEINTYDLP